MTNGQTLLYRIVTFENVVIGAADRDGGGNTNQGIVWPDILDLIVIQFNSSAFNKNEHIAFNRAMSYRASQPANYY